MEVASRWAGGSRRRRIRRVTIVRGFLSLVLLLGLGESTAQWIDEGASGACFLAWLRGSKRVENISPGLQWERKRRLVSKCLRVFSSYIFLSSNSLEASFPDR
jgi:hypothetical protein